MPSDLFWNGDAKMVRFYREADQIRMERTDAEAWLQGMYIYEALCDVAPIYNTFAKKGTKPAPYTDAPYMTKKRKEEERQEGYEMFEKVRDWATRWNAKWEREQEKEGGRG